MIIKSSTILFTLLLVLIATTACSANNYAVINTIHLETKRNDTFAVNTAQVGNSSTLHGNKDTRSIRLGVSQSGKIKITLFTTGPDYSPDPMLIDLALNHVQKAWGRMLDKRKNSTSPIPELSIDFWLIPQGGFFSHRVKSIVNPADTLELTFASDFSKNKPAIDGIAEFVNVLNHELYHVSQFGLPEIDSVIEEFNAHAWGYCSKFRFASASGESAVFRWHVQPVWEHRVWIDSGILHAHVPRDIRTPIKRSQFGLAIFYQFLSTILDSNTFDVSNAKQMTIINEVCNHIEEQGLGVVLK